jgi:hypothetical protein
MKKLVVLISILLSTISFSQNVIKVETKDTACVRILRNTYGFNTETYSDSTYTFNFNQKSLARIVTNLALKEENVHYKIIK